MKMVKEKGASTEVILEKLFEGARKFEVVDAATGEKREYFLVLPNAEQTRASQWEYSKSYNLALKQGIFTSDELIDILKRRNIIGDDYEARLEELRTDLRQKLLELELSESKDEKIELAKQASEVREEIIRWNARFAGPMGNTCEQLATDARNEYLTSVVVRNQDGSYVWPEYEDYINEKDQELYLKARLEVMMWLEGLEPDFLKNEPDQVILREVELEAEAEAEAAIQAAVAATEEVVEEPKKTSKRGRKKSKK